MNDSNIKPMDDSEYQAFTKVMDALSSLADESLNNENTMSRLDTDPRGELSAKGVDIPEGVGINVVINSKDTFHLVMPPNPNHTLVDEALSKVAGGADCAGTVGSVGSASTFSTFPGCLGCGGSAGTVGSAGSAG